MSKVQSNIQSLSNSSNYQNILQVDQPQSRSRQFKPPSNSDYHPIVQQIEKKLTSSFFQDHTQEEYVIHRAFNKNNFTYLRNLPDNFKHGEILNKRKQKVIGQTQHESLTRSKPFEDKYNERVQKIKLKKKQQVGTLGYFTVFDYKQSNYQMPKILDSLQRIQSEKKRKEISSLNFRPSGIQSKLKYQDPFRFLEKVNGSNSQSTNSQYLFPFHLPQDTYNIYQESQKRRKIISDSLKVHGDFIPSKHQHTLTKVNRQQLNQIVNQIQLFLKNYIKNVGFFIGVTKQDHIEVLFEKKQKDNSKVSMMMSKICEHQMISRFVLRRNLTKWAKIYNDKQYLVYCILPSWVKNPPQILSQI